MITFGAAFGYTVMGRIALLAIRLEFLLDDWLWLIDPSRRRAIAMLLQSLLGNSADQKGSGAIFQGRLRKIAPDPFCCCGMISP